MTKIFTIAVALLLLSACGHGNGRLVLHVRGASMTAPTSASCFLVIRQRVVEGGTSTYCLKRFTGRPGPNATLRESGLLSLALPQRTIRAHVRIVARFAADGRHATQTLHGTVVGGGTITGGGSYVEQPPGHVASSNLRYVVTEA